MLQAVKTVLSKYATFSGRASRSELWWWILAVFILLIITRIIDGAVIAPTLGFSSFEPNAGQPLSLLVSLAFLLPNIAVGARRFHDIGKSGWWILIGLVPLVGTLVLIYFFVQPSDDANEYGPPNPFDANA
jgi:uncharacterized membrane protein YhaH (DUF805 family)